MRARDRRRLEAVEARLEPDPELAALDTLARIFPEVLRKDFETLAASPLIEEAKRVATRAIGDRSARVVGVWSVGRTRPSAAAEARRARRSARLKRNCGVSRVKEKAMAKQDLAAVLSVYGSTGRR